MTHQQRHRGQHPEDARLFSNAVIPKLRQSLADYCWLLTKGYAANASLKLVGDRFLLTDRQRLLLMRCACSEQQRQNRKRNEVPSENIKGRDLYIDGFNVLITLESAMSGAFVFVGSDGCYRDLSSVHGTYKRVLETKDAIQLVGRTLHELEIGTAHWLLDSPVSNSGRLKQILLAMGSENNWNWDVQLAKSPDTDLKRANQLTATTDGVILDSVDAWFALGNYVIDHGIPNANRIDLNSE